MATLTIRPGDWRGAYDRVRAIMRRRTVQTVAFAAALALFAGGAFVSFRARPELLSTVDWPLVAALAFVFAPGLVLLNALLTQIIARAAGASMDFQNSLKVSVLSSAANYLPLPGGPALRTVLMKEAGASLKAAAGATLAGGCLWFGVTFLYAGGWALAFSAVMAAALVMVSAPFLAAGAIILRRVSNDRRHLLSLLGWSAAAVVYYSAGFWISLNAVGLDAGYARAVVISVAGVIGAAVSLAPGGLGVREVAASLLAVQVGAPPAQAFIASALFQLTTLAPLMLAALAFAAGPFRKRPASG